MSKRKTLSRETLAEFNRRTKTTHGDSKSPLYRCWRSMNDRCVNERNKYYHRYGGRGIAVCKNWRKDYMAFRKWANANGYSEKLTIDRIDNNKGYSPANCRFSTKKEQNSNRSDSKTVTINGVTMPRREASDKFGISIETIKSRQLRGWSDEDIVFTPIRGHGNAVKFRSKNNRIRGRN